MAKDKKSFVLYADLIGRVEHLTNEEKGILFQHLLDYVNDLNPVLEDRILIGVWKPIEQQLKRDLKKFEEVKIKRSEAGKRSAELRALKKYNQEQTKPTSVESVKQTSTNPTVNDSVNVNDNVSTNVDEKTIDNIFLEHRQKYKVYATQLFKDTIFLESISKEFIRNESKEVIQLTLKKYLGLFLNSLDQTKKIHNNKKEFQQHFPAWMRKQPAIVKVYPKEKEIRYS